MTAIAIDRCIALILCEGVLMMIESNEREGGLLYRAPNPKPEFATA